MKVIDNKYGEIKRADIKLKILFQCFKVMKRTDNKYGKRADIKLTIFSEYSTSHENRLFNKCEKEQG